MLAHGERGLLRGEHDAGEQGVDFGAQRRRFQREQRCRDLRLARIVEQDVEPATPGHCAVDQRAQCGVIGHVGCDEVDALAQFPHEFAAALCRATRCDHPRALGNEPAHRGGTDAARAAGDQCDPTLESSQR